MLKWEGWLSSSACVGAFSTVSAECLGHQFRCLSAEVLLLYLPSACSQWLKGCTALDGQLSRPCSWAHLNAAPEGLVPQPRQALEHELDLWQALAR